MFYTNKYEQQRERLLQYLEKYRHILGGEEIKKIEAKIEDLSHRIDLEAEQEMEQDE